MTKDEFQNQSLDFMTSSQAVAENEAKRYNEIGVDGYIIVAARFGNMWCVMLKDAFDFTRELGI